ncbi:MAG: hypothetical protein H6713_13750 [Myxococcales bacterium]|nr:hypothetical protein [Myxococcales bacterium]
MRERVLGEFGSLLLGTGHDDGLHIPWYSTYLCSNFDVVATLSRLRSLARHFGWSWSRVVAVDETAEVLARALAELLDRPYDEETGETETGKTEGDADDDALAVAAILAPSWHDAPRGPSARARAACSRSRCSTTADTRSRFRR